MITMFMFLQCFSVRFAVNSTHGQLDTCVELTRLRKSQLDTSQVDTGVNLTHGQLDT